MVQRNGNVTNAMNYTALQLDPALVKYNRMSTFGVLSHALFCVDLDAGYIWSWW